MYTFIMYVYLYMYVHIYLWWVYTLNMYCCCSVTESCLTLCDPMGCSMPGLQVSQSLLKLMSIELVMPCNHLVLCCPLLLLLSIFPSIRLFSKNRLFISCGQNIGVSASASVLPMNIQEWFPLGLTSLISLQSNGLSRVFSNTTVPFYYIVSFCLVCLKRHTHTKKTI